MSTVNVSDAERYLDCQPLAAPVNPFAWMIANLKAKVYHSQAELDAAMAARGWLQSLQQRLGDELNHRDPVILTAICRIAINGVDRDHLDRATRAIDAVVAEFRAKAAAEAAGHAPPKSNGAGLRMPD